MTAGLILAAGAGTRFGPEPKQLASYHGRPLLEHVLGAMTAVTELERIAVVLGAAAQEIQSQIEFGRAEVVVCDDWALGMSATLQAGAGVLAGADRIVVVLGDGPLLTPQHVRRFSRAPAGARAVYGGVPGHPVVLGPAQLSRLDQLDGDEGARRLLGDGPLIDCSDLGAPGDVDTQADRARLDE